MNNKVTINVKEKNKISAYMIDVALKLGLEVEYISKSIFFISNGFTRILFAGCMPETTSAVEYKLTENKNITNSYLKKNGFQVPLNENYNSFESAMAFLGICGEIVVKPRSGIHGKGISIGVKTKEDLRKAIAYAKSNDRDKKIILEEFCHGDDHRLLVIGNKKVFCLKRLPAHVTGNGSSNISELIDKYNKNENPYQYKINKNALTKKNLLEQGYELNSVPEENTRVFLRKTANIKSGGLSIDCTQVLNPEVKDAAISISKLLKMTIVGIDYLTEDITKNKGKFIEINAYPGILPHKYPSVGSSYDVAEELLNFYFFPEKFNEEKIEKADIKC